MHSRHLRLGRRGIFVATLLVLLVFWVAAAPAQSSTNSPGVAQSAVSDSEEPAKSGQPATPDVAPSHVAGIHSESFIIGGEDVLTINVWKEPEMSKSLPVRPDGIITLPLI